MVNFTVEMMTKMVTNPDDDGCLIMIRNPPFKSQWIGEHSGPENLKMFRPKKIVKLNFNQFHGILFLYFPFFMKVISMENIKKQLVKLIYLI